MTGAGRGLGFEIAKALATAGARVVLNGRDAARLATAAARIEGEVAIAAFDVASPDAEENVAAIAAQHGLDILVNNVGQRGRQPLDDFDLDGVRALTEANLVAPLMMARAPHGRWRGWGAVGSSTSPRSPDRSRTAGRRFIQ